MPTQGQEAWRFDQLVAETPEQYEFIVQTLGPLMNKAAAARTVGVAPQSVQTAILGGRLTEVEYLGVRYVLVSEVMAWRRKRQGKETICQSTESN